MNKESIIELLQSNNADDVTLGIIIAIKHYSQEELHRYFNLTRLKVEFLGDIIKYDYKGKSIIRDRHSLFIYNPDNHVFWNYDKTVNLNEDEE